MADLLPLCHILPQMKRILGQRCSSSAAVSDRTNIDRLRRNAARFLPIWLSRDPAFRDSVFEQLKLTAQRDKNLYEDSLPSFAVSLKKGPPPALHETLDDMVNAGLATKRLAESYRHNLKKRGTTAELHDSLLNDTEGKLRFYQQQCTDFEKEIDTLAKVVGSSSRSVDIAKLELFQEKLKQSQTSVQTCTKKIERIKMEQKMSLSDEEKKVIETTSARVQPHVTRAFADHVKERHSQILEQFQSLDARTDLTRPHDWFLHARLSRRKIIYHGGPTNSGKTYSALERLKQAKRGMYYGPLRLLAAEVYEKLTAEGIYCNLFTGQESREIPFATHGAATVEMALMNEDHDVVVIDEIQMIGDNERGYAWTRALLGSRCPEIHVCGGLEAVDVVRRMAKACGDEFELKRYDRFSELHVAEKSLSSREDSLGSYKKVREGDCIVAFSIADIFAIKREIENNTKHKCCVIYGSLPPSTRSEQARRFNDPESGYDVLVASDAIGMGLNLNIRRIIFNSILKNNGFGIVRLTHSHVKQISGRAGRRNSPFPVGEVTTRDPRDIDYLRQCLKTEIKPVSQAGLVPTGQHIETFSETLEQYQGTKDLHKVLRKFNEMANVKSDYFLCRRTPILDIAKLLSPVELSIPDKFMMCLCPVSTKHSGSLQMLQRFAGKLSAGEVAGLNNATIPKPANRLDDISRLCHLFNEIELFLWLQRKFPPGNIMETHTATTRRDMCIKFIGEGLKRSDELRLNHCYIKRDLRLRKIWMYDNGIPYRKKVVTKRGAEEGDSDDDRWF